MTIDKKALDTVMLAYPEDVRAFCREAFRPLLEAYESAKTEQPVELPRTIECVLFQHFSNVLAGTDFKDDPKKQKYIDATKEVMRYVEKAMKREAGCDIKCRGCDGRGEIARFEYGEANPGYDTEVCHFCNGTGKESVWQPIETAPRDGFHILLYRPEICFVGYYAAGGDWVISAPDLPPMYPAPTHWMPLPKAPTTQLEAESPAQPAAQAKAGA
jgi:hypothetical protein